MIWLFRFFVLIGLLIVVALFSALLAPYYINWERFTSEFEQQASKLVGQPVKVEGNASLRLLPLPYINFEGLEVGESEDGSPLMTVEQFSLTAELFPFLSGEVRIVDMAMFRPQVNLEVSESGTIAWTSPRDLPVDLEQINIENISVENGSMTINGLAEGRQITVDNLSGNLSARSILGPWRMNTKAEVEGIASEFKISTGTYQPNARSLRVKVEAVRQDQPYKVLLDGPVKLEEDVLNWEGDFSIAPFSELRIKEMLRPVEPLPVLVEGEFLMTPQSLSVPDYRMEVGSPEDPYTITGNGNVYFQDEVFFKFDANGRQIDLDRLERSEGSLGTGTFESRLAILGSVLERIPVPVANGRIDANLPAVVAGDTFIREVKTTIQPIENGWNLQSFSAVFPGNTVVEAAGNLDLEGGFGFDGELVVLSRQPSGFAAWMSGGVDAQIRRLKVLGLQSNVKITSQNAVFDNLVLQMDDASLKGKLERTTYTDERPKLKLELKGNKVNIENLRGLYSLARDPSEVEMTSHDLEIKVAADLLEARFRDRPVSATGVNTHVTVESGSVMIEELRAEEFYGAKLGGSGAFKNLLERPDGAFELTVDSEDPSELLEFVGGFTGEHFLLSRLQREPDLTRETNLKAVLSMRSAGSGSNGTLLLDGTMGGTRIDTDISLVGDFATRSNLELSLENSFTSPSVSVLFRQFAIETLPDEILGTLPGPVRLVANFSGDPDELLKSSILFSGPETNLTANGNVKFTSSEDADFDLDVTVGSQNLAPYLTVLGAALPGIGIDTKLPVSLTFNLEKQNPSSRITEISGQIAGNKIAGDLTYQFLELQRPRLSGELELSRLPVPLIAASVFGFSDLLGSGFANLGVDREFQTAGVTGYDARVRLSAETIVTGFGFSGERASSELVMFDGATDLNELRFDAFGGQFNGGISLKNTERTVLGSLRYSLVDADLARILDATGLEHSAKGKVTINGSAETSGRSQSAMLSNLSGNGVVAVKNAEITDVDPTAFPKILLETDVEGFEISPERVAELVNETVLVSGFELDQIDAPYSITRGKVKIRNLVHTTSEADFTSSMVLDIPQAEMEAEMNLAFKPGKRNAISGAEPAVKISWNGPLSSVARQVEGGQLEGYLSLRAFENSQRRIETLEAQVIEKQRIQREIAFNFAREQFDIRREQALRIVGEAERRRMEEAVRKLGEERLRLEEKARLEEEAARLRIEEEKRLQAEEQARLTEENRRKADERWLLEEEVRQQEERERLEREIRLSTEAAAKELKATEGGGQSSEQIQGEPLPPAEPSTQVNPTLRESIIENIENFLSTD